MTDQIVEYLRDSQIERQPGFVYLTLWPNEKISTPAHALEFLRGKSRPLSLLPVQWGGTLPVVLAASDDPRIWLGRRAPTGNWEADLAQIIRVLEENGIEAEVSLDSARSAAQDTSRRDDPEITSHHVP